MNIKGSISTHSLKVGDLILLDEKSQEGKSAFLIFKIGTEIGVFHLKEKKKYSYPSKHHPVFTKVGILVRT